MKCFSMFSGIGGFDLALRNQGHETIAACEIDKYARQVYGKHFPRVPIYEDATRIKPDELPDFDILCAGFPCQAFSIAGKRLGFEESRGTLFFEIARIAKQRRPRLLLLENVKGLLSHDNGRTFAEILYVLDELGYDAEWQVLNSKYWVPQNRERIFIIGYPRGEPRPEVFPLRNGNQVDNGSHPKAQGEGERLRGRCVRALESTYYKGGAHGTIIKTMGTSQRSTVVDPSGINPTFSACTHGYGNNLIQLNTPKHSSHRVYSSEGLGRALKANTGAKTGLYAIPIMFNNKGMNGRRQKTHNEPVFTIDTYASAGINTGSKVRRLTPLECERLQGFPDGWTEGISDTQRYKCLGNAVTVPVVEEIVSRL